MNAANAPSDLIRFACPHCGKPLRAPPEMAGKVLSCPNQACGKPIKVALQTNSRSTPPNSRPGGTPKEMEPIASGALIQPTDADSLGGSRVGEKESQGTTHNSRWFRAAPSFVIAWASVAMSLLSALAPILAAFGLLGAIGVLFHSWKRKSGAWRPALLGIVTPLIIFQVMMRFEDYRWSIIEHSNSKPEYQDYLRAFPNGEHAPMARERIATLVRSERDVLEGTRELFREREARWRAEAPDTADTFQPPYYVINDSPGVKNRLEPVILSDVNSTSERGRAGALVYYTVELSEWGRWVTKATRDDQGPAYASHVSVIIIDAKDPTRRYRTTTTIPPNSPDVLIPKTKVVRRCPLPEDLVKEVIHSVTANK